MNIIIVLLGDDRRVTQAKFWLKVSLVEKRYLTFMSGGHADLSSKGGGVIPLAPPVSGSWKGNEPKGVVIQDLGSGLYFVARGERNHHLQGGTGIVGQGGRGTWGYVLTTTDKGM
ncbi:unnamed protein product [Lupinus luteus]|uniref:Uncharacterized protein n=1 Tax=Lupinus luteus TaxID=3873 RepID=A0AAV1Y5W6_LUPLU